MESTGVQTRTEDAINSKVVDIQHLVFFGDGRVPYDNPVPESEHRKIKIRSIDWLLDEGIISKAEESSSLTCKFLTPDEWRMIQSTPEHYWPCAFAKELTEREYQHRLSRFVPPPSNPLYKNHYLRNQRVWIAVSNILFEQKYHKYPTRAEEEQQSEFLFPIYCAFYALLNGVELPLSYPWGETVISYCDKKRKEEDEKLKLQRAGRHVTEWALA